MNGPDVDADSKSGSRHLGYARVNGAVWLSLSFMTAWVALGHGFPGGSLHRRLTGEEGMTGGLTTAVRHLLRGDFELGMSQHPAALWVLLYLVSQLLWRALALWLRPDPQKIWVLDLVASLVLFAAAIYVPWWTRGA